MIKIAIQPLSVNKCWRGRRFKTRDYDVYERDVFRLLPKMEIIGDQKMKLKIQVGFSSKASDADNMLKPFIDILQKKYGFNDKKIYKIELEKVDVEKGEEFIAFDVEYI